MRHIDPIVEDLEEKERIHKIKVKELSGKKIAMKEDTFPTPVHAD